MQLWYGIHDLDDCVMLAIAGGAIAWGIFKLIKGESHMQTASIGYHREDGDFRLLATVSNIDDELNTKQFEALVTSTANRFKALGIPVVVLDRQDAPDYIDLEGDDQEQAV